MDEIALIQWWEVYKCDTVDEAVKTFTKLVCSILDRNDMAPVKTFQHKQQYAPWLSDETKAVMTERDSAQMQAQLTGTPEDCVKANMLGNRSTQLLRTEKTALSKTEA